MDETELSPLFWPVLPEPDGFSVLDETRLPWEIHYVPIRRVAEAVEIVREMRTRAFGQVLTFFHSALLLLKDFPETDQDAVEAAIRDLGRVFSEARPTFAFRGLAEQVLAGLPKGGSGDPRALYATGIERHLKILRRTRQKRCELAASLLPQACSILTHCNASGDMVLIGTLLRQRGANVRFYATETRPYLQGSRLTAWELSRAGFEVHLLPDRGAGQVIEQGLVNAVIVGSDRSTRRGDVVNKVGTYPLALLAKAHEIPFYALVQDFEQALADHIPIEERPHGELITFRGRRLAPEGVKCRYPAFDLTPANLVTRLIGFGSTYSHRDFAEKFAGGKKSTELPSEDSSYLLVFGVPEPGFYRHLADGSRIESRGEILVPELRPSLVGAREVAPMLLQTGLKPTLVSDNMLGFFFQRDAIRRAYLAYREFAPSGPVLPAGARMVALLARAHEVPIELVPAGEDRAEPLDADATTLLQVAVSSPGVSPWLVQDELVPWSLF